MDGDHTYDDRIIAFLDIQGFSKDVKESQNDPKLFYKIKQILGNLKTMEDKTSRSIIFDKLNLFSDDDRTILKNGYECTAVSDSIVISFPAIEAAFEFMCIELAMLQWDFLWKWNYLLRGYISRGPCFHRDGIIFGQGYSNAYEGAEKNESHKLPYILIQDELVINSNPDNEPTDSLYKKDHLDRYFINYASLIKHSPTYTIKNINAEEQLKRAIHFINSEFENATSDKVKNKYYWTYKYINQRINL